MKTIKLFLLQLILIIAIVSNVNATTISANNTKIQYFGRWDFTNPLQPIAGWGSAYIKIKFTGTSISIKLTDTQNAFQYSIDDGAMIKLVAGLGASTTLATGLTTGEHSLAFYRRSGGSWGRTLFDGFEITNGDIINPNPEKCLKFEFVGNSISVGFNNEGIAGVSNNVNSENGYNAWGPQLARLYDGDWRVEAHSGQGMYMNLYNNPSTPDAWTMADEFELLYFPVWIGGDMQTLWKFADGFQPDVFMCGLGTNDYANAYGYPTRTQFNGRYNEFLNLIRSKYPEATIILFGMCIKTWDYSKQWDIANDNIQALVDARKLAGDNNIFFANPRPDKTDATLWLPNETDYVGDWTHPTVAGDAIIASKIKTFMDGNSFIKNRLDLKINACKTNTTITTANDNTNQNVSIYPNPSSTYITINYTLNEASNVRVEIYDITGKIINIMNISNSSVGENKINWDGTNNTGQYVNNGVYYIKTITTNYSKTVMSIIQK